jgi:hypothetical protein
MKSATSSPNARPWTLGKGRPIGTAEVPPIRSARPWVGVVSHGISWVSIVFRNKTVDFEMAVVCQFQPHHLVADLLLLTSGRDIRATSCPRGIACRSSPCSAIAAPRQFPIRSAPCSVRRARLTPPRSAVSEAPVATMPIQLPGCFPGDPKGTGDPMGSPAPSP